MLLFAQAASAIDPLTGWGSLLLQAGAFGLLCFIVIKIYPQSQREGREERERRDVLFAKMLDVLQEKFEARKDDLISAVRAQERTIVKAIENQTTHLTAELRAGHGCKAAMAKPV